jgi:hypothetical protein
VGNGGLYSSLPLHFKRGMEVNIHLYHLHFKRGMEVYIRPYHFISSGGGKDEYKPPFTA